MKHRLAGMAFGILWGIMLVSAQTASLKEEPSLQAPITLRAKFLPLRDLIQQVAKQSEVRLGIDRKYEHEKVTIFVKDRPMWEVLEQVAQVTDLEWRSEKSGSYFLAPTKSRLEQEKAIQQARARQRRVAEEQIRRYQKDAQKDYLEIVAELDNRKRSIEQQISQLRQSQPPGWEEQVEALESQLFQIADSMELNPYLLGRFSATWGREAWQMLWEGTPLVAIYPSKSSHQSIPADSINWYQKWVDHQRAVRSAQGIEMPGFSYEGVEKVAFIVRYNPLQERLEYGTTALVRYQDVLLPGDTTISYMDISAAWECLSESGAVNRDDSSLQPLAEIALKETSRSSEAEYHDSLYTLAEVLEWLAQQTDLPIVAQAFRRSHPEPFAALTSAKTAYDLFRALNRYGIRYEFVYEGDYLKVRYRCAPLLRLYEPPESLLQPFEAKVRSEGALSLNDYAELANQLTPNQVLFFTASQTVNSTLGRPVVRFDPTPLESAFPALRFWASLHRAQRDSALQAAPLSYSQLTSVQRRLFWEAIFHNSSDYNGVWVYLSALEPESEDMLAFFLDRYSDEGWIVTAENTSMPNEVGEGWSWGSQSMSITVQSEEEAKALLEKYYPAKLKRYKNGIWNMMFGLSNAESIVYTITIPAKSSQ